MNRQFWIPLYPTAWMPRLTVKFTSIGVHSQPSTALDLPLAPVLLSSAACLAFPSSTSRFPQASLRLHLNAADLVGQFTHFVRRVQDVLDLHQDSFP